MSHDIQELRRLAEAAKATNGNYSDLAWQDFDYAASPSTILALIEENERLAEAVKRLLLEFDFLIEAGELPDIWDDMIFEQARAALKETTDV